MAHPDLAASGGLHALDPVAGVERKDKTPGAIVDVGVPVAFPVCPSPDEEPFGLAEGLGLVGLSQVEGLTEFSFVLVVDSEAVGLVGMLLVGQAPRSSSALARGPAVSKPKRAAEGGPWVANVLGDCSKRTGTAEDGDRNQPR